MLLGSDSENFCRVETAYEWKAMENHLEDTLCHIDGDRTYSTREGSTQCPLIEVR